MNFKFKFNKEENKLGLVISFCINSLTFVVFRSFITESLLLELILLDLSETPLIIK